MTQLVDYVAAGTYNESCFPFMKPLVGQGKGNRFIAIFKLDEPVKRLDGKMGRYLVRDCWLSRDCQNTEDQSWACVVHDAEVFFMHKQVKDILADLKKGEIDIFDYGIDL